MKSKLVVGLVLFAMQLSAQSSIPAGTVLPVALNSSLNSRKVKAGQVITARIMQDIPLSPGSTIRAGAKVIGHVIDVKSASDTRDAQISFQFDTLAVSRRQMPIVTNLRALASMMAVEGAQVPETGPDRGTSENEWTTDQIGDEVVYHGGGPVTNGMQVVGKSTANGVLVRVASGYGTRCRGEIDGNEQPQALWLFASNACGVYDLPKITIAHAGRTNPIGQIVLRSTKGNLNVRAGSGMLLRVNNKVP